MHSSYSDGLGSVQSIMAQAAAADVDFVVLADHNTLRARDEGLEGWHGNALLLVGEEVTPDTNSNHYLALDAREVVPPSPDPAENIRAVREAGGIGIVAHPTGGYLVHGEYVEYPWTDWNAGRVDGLEIWDHAYDIAGKSKNLLQLGLWFLLPHLAPSGPLDEVLKVWDHLVTALGRPTTGIAGTDCHGMLGPYRSTMRSVCTYIVAEEPFSGVLEHDAQLVYSAIREGRCYVGGDKIRDAAGFTCYVRSGGERIHMGSTARLSRGATLMVTSPAESLIRVIRNGEVVLEQRGSQLEANLNARGVYRVEAALSAGKRDKPWIYGNHIWVV